MINITAGILPTQDEANKILADIENYQSYYAGGTLCVDLLGGEDILFFNLSEKFGFLVNGNPNSFLDTENTKLLFDIYKKHKGETEHYKSSLQKSHIRDLIN